MNNVIYSNVFRIFAVLALSCVGLLITVYYGKELVSYYFQGEAHVYSKGINFSGADALVMSFAFMAAGIFCFYASYFYYKKWFGNK